MNFAVVLNTVLTRVWCVFAMVCSGHVQEMLLDLLVHSEGPRMRDRVSHGEVS